MDAITSTGGPACYRLIVRLPDRNLLPGFRPDEWTILNDFGEEVEALAGTRSVGRLLGRLGAEGVVVREAGAAPSGGGVLWTILRRFDVSGVDPEPAEAVAAEAEALLSWNGALAASLGSPRAKRKPARPTLAPALGLIASVVGIGLAAAAASTWTAGIPDGSAEDAEFMRRGGFHATVPDRARQGWYVRLKVHPNGSSEVTKRLSEAELLKDVDLEAEVRRRLGIGPASAPKGSAPGVAPDMIGRIDGVAAAFRRRS
ncbi:hypothetical protein BHAOGJBA_4257 [Methylobacterium hispanicum]|uniref:Anti-sigma factor n=1 Tax=Methylobacterium hispanicum TaxID=270350 RepID=A0AAV4ZRW2_9HYPH|nr:hypothetical protein [Methylobacterium hispanicum]GJD90715.1 hypothetical protein BHAOGJBA_4257 [Methylobacterium hispanicum]